MTEQIFQQREMRIKTEPKTTIIVYDPSDETYNSINGGCPKSKAEYEEFLKRELTFRNVLLIIITESSSPDKLDPNLRVRNISQPEESEHP